MVTSFLSICRIVLAFLIICICVVLGILLRTGTSYGLIHLRFLLNILPMFILDLYESPDFTLSEIFLEYDYPYLSL